MKTLYIECKMGVAGDMLTAALIDLLDDKKSIVESLNKLNIPGVKFKLENCERCGISGKKMSVLVYGQEERIEQEHSHEYQHEYDDEKQKHYHQDHSNEKQEHDHHEHSDENHEHDHHDHHSIYDIEDIIENLETSKDVKSDIREVYQLLAEAEGNVHGKPVSQIHFHEVGNMDAIADIAAVCYLMHEIDADKIIVSPINVGGGTVKCAHGVLPVPAPATAYLLNGIPSYESETIRSELCTPTGAALVKYFAFDFSQQPIMEVNKIGYGMGKKEFEQVNCVRAILGESADEVEHVIELSCNVDDMTPEEVGFATERLFDAGALEVYTITIGMKKNRPGVLLTCMCKEDQRDKMLKEIFKNTTTIGVRENTSNRYILTRERKKIETPYGEVRVKNSYGYDVYRSKLEYDDLAGIARRTGKSILELKKEIQEM